MTSSRRQLLGLWSGYLIAVLALLFVARYLNVNWAEFVAATGRVEFERLLVAVVLYLSCLALNAMAFAMLVRSFSTKVAAKPLIGAWLMTLLAKYVPVGVGHIMGRGLVLASHGITARVTIGTGIVEQIFSLLLCAAVAVMTYAVREGWLSISILALSIVLLAVTLAVLGGWAKSRISNVHWPLLIISFALYAVAMVPYAATYVVIVEPSNTLNFLSPLFAGTIAGFAAILVPGGLGVRESVTTALSDPQATAGLLAALVAVRLAILFAEMIAAIVGHRIIAIRGAAR